MIYGGQPYDIYAFGSLPGYNYITGVNSTNAALNIFANPAQRSKLIVKNCFNNISATPLYNDSITTGLATDSILVTKNLTAKKIKNNSTNWNAAYSWGNHAGLYRPANYVPAWDEITGKPAFAAVATSGNYTDLHNKPQTGEMEALIPAVSDKTGAGTRTSEHSEANSSTGRSSHFIGENYGSGIVFYTSD
ncbi:MAG: hypothetical protein WCJ95_21800 [Mariniphaga sp.]